MIDDEQFDTALRRLNLEPELFLQGREESRTVRVHRRRRGSTRWRWPVLFWLPNTRRELNLHQLLAGIDIPGLVATAADDHATTTGQSPADNVWWLHGHEGARLRLAELPYDNPDTSEETL